MIYPAEFMQDFSLSFASQTLTQSMIQIYIALSTCAGRTSSNSRFSPSFVIVKERIHRAKDRAASRRPQWEEDEIKNIICAALRGKLSGYKPESQIRPFHTSLIDKDRLALFSFIQSLNTTFGVSIFEPVAVILAANNFRVAKKGEKIGTRISAAAQAQIQKI